MDVWITVLRTLLVMKVDRVFQLFVRRWHDRLHRHAKTIYHNVAWWRTVTDDSKLQRNVTLMKKWCTMRSITAMHYDDVQWRHATTNDNGLQQRLLLSAAGNYCCRPRFANLLILPTYDFNSNDMQSTVISFVPVIKHATQMSGTQTFYVLASTWMHP